jgi:hypothetical protein
VIWTWNCRDTNNVLVPDGNYKFWLQYAEDSGQGPYTTNGMLWVKGPAPATNTYPNELIRDKKVVWNPIPPPEITSFVKEGSNLILSGTGTAAKTCVVLSATNLTGTNTVWYYTAHGKFDDDGQFSYTNAIDGSVPKKFYKLLLQ